MAIAATYNKKQEELNRQQGAVGSRNPYSGMAGVSTGTANQLGNYQSGYKPSDTVNQANQALANVNAQKPQSFSGKYGPQLEGILKQITNPQEFKYDFNGDEIFKYYADLYTQKGKQASMDAMGQAAGLTGGYGNSYAQQVGQQGYKQYLLSLYDKGLDLYDRAYQRSRDRAGDNLNAYNVLQDADARDYDRYRDTMADWQAEREYAANRADTERNFDYGQYADQLNYWTQLAQVENKAYNTEAERQEAIRQFNQQFAESQRQYNTSLSEDRRQFDANLAEKQRQADMDEGYRRDTLAENQRQYDADLAEKIRQYDASLAENQRQANLDEGYRRDTLAEQQRQANLDNDYRYSALAQDQRQHDTNMAEKIREYDASLAEQMRQANLDEGYRRDTLAENIRQANMDNDYRNNALAQDKQQFDATSELNWAKLEESQRQYDASLTEEQRQYNRNLAVDYVTSILANGQIPSNELLIAAGLSREDAEKLLAQTGVVSGGKGPGPDKGSGTDDQSKRDEKKDKAVDFKKEEPETLMGKAGDFVSGLAAAKLKTDNTTKKQTPASEPAPAAEPAATSANPAQNIMDKLATVIPQQTPQATAQAIQQIAPAQTETPRITASTVPTLASAAPATGGAAQAKTSTTAAAAKKINTTAVKNNTSGAASALQAAAKALAGKKTDEKLKQQALAKISALLK